MKITRRDIKFFLLGILTMFILETVFDWEGSKKSFMDGYNSATQKKDVSIDDE